MDGYSLEGGECLKNMVEHCSIHEISNSCKVCADGYGLKDQDGAKICIVLP